MRVLVTGVSGFAGRHLAALLVSGGHAVTGLGRPADAPAPPGVVMRVADLTQAELLRSAVVAAQPDVIYHLAAASSPAQAARDPLGTLQVNVLGTAALLEAAVACARPPRLLVVTSSEVYGQPASAEPLTEDSPPAPRGVYGTSKLMVHELLQQYHRTGGLEIVEARPFNHIGPGQRLGFVVPDFAAQVQAVAEGRQRPVVEVGDLSAARDFTDVRDIVRGYVALAVGGEPGQVYHLCSGRAVTAGELLTRLMALSGVTAEVQVADARWRNGGSVPIIGSYQRAQAAVGWTPQIALDATLRDVLAEWAGR